MNSNKTYIPNFDTISTLIDRLSIENVKLAHFENELEHDEPREDRKLELNRKIQSQKRIIEALREETTKRMEEIFINGKYECITEERTFV